MTLLEQTLQQLDQLRGQWPDIARRSGVPYHTLTRIAQRKSPDPRVSTVQRLHDCMRLHYVHHSQPSEQAVRELATEDG